MTITFFFYRFGCNSKFSRNYDYFSDNIHMHQKCICNFLDLFEKIVQIFLIWEILDPPLKRARPFSQTIQIYQWFSNTTKETEAFLNLCVSQLFSQLKWCVRIPKSTCKQFEQTLRCWRKTYQVNWSCGMSVFWIHKVGIVGISEQWSELVTKMANNRQNTVNAMAE